MSDHSLNEEDEELQLESYKYEVSPTPPSVQTETDSDRSTDSSSTTRKQLKSPHTLLKHASSGSPEGNISSNSTLIDQAEHYQRLLQEAEQSLSSRDVLIAMLQEQLKKIENIYKQSLDDAQDLRYKYCVTTQELSNLKTICAKYKEDVEILTKKEKNENVSKTELQNLQKQADEWKAQYKNLLRYIEEIAATTSKISEEIQVDLLDNRDRQTDVNTIKNHCINIKNCLQQQNEKIDILVRKMQEDIQRPENNQKELQQELSSTSAEPLVKPMEECINLSLKCKKLQIEENPNQLNSNEELKDSQKMIDNKNLKYEVEMVKIEIEQINKKNLLLQTDTLERDKLEEIQKLNVQLCNEESAEPIHYTISAFDVKDSVTENLKKENAHLREQLETMKNMARASADTSEECYSQNESDNGSTGTNDYPQQARNRQASRVSFAVTPNHLESELMQMHQENSELKLKIRKLQGDNKGKDEMEKMTVELVNLRRQLKQKEEEVDLLTNEVETIASRKKAILQEYQNANKLLKSDCQELLTINRKLTQDLNTKTPTAYEKGASNQSSSEESSNSRDYTKAYNTNKPKLNNKTQEPNEMANDINRNIAEIIKEAVIQSIHTEMEKLKATLCNKTECEMVNEENRKIKDKLNGKTTELETIRNDLQMKTANILEKETIIKNKISEIEHLKRKLIDNNTALQEIDKIKNELNNKKKEIVENTTEIQNLHTTINVLKAKLAKALQKDQNNDADLQNYKECKCKIKKLEAKVSELTDLTEKLKNENESLESKINMMKNTLQQYREEAQFKKLENEKLRKKEEELKSAISQVRRNNDNIAREYHKEVENNKIALSEISKERNSIEKQCQDKINKFNVENEEIKNLLQEKNEETKELTNNINTITKELETTKLLNQKHLNTCERSLSEITCLFKNKEDELISALSEFQEVKENIQILEEENKRLKKLLQDIVQEQENKEYSFHLKHTTELKIIEENYNNEKIKNSEFNVLLDNIRRELHNLKIQLQDLLNNLEYKLKLLKNDLLNYKGDMSLSKKNINEMLDCIKEFNSGVVQHQRTTKSNDSIEETEKYSYYYEKESYVTNEDAVETLICASTNCKNKNNAINNRPSSTPCIGINLPECNQDFSSMTMKALQIKRDYIIQKLDSIEQTLNNRDCLPVIKIVAPRCIQSSESVITSHTKNSDSYFTCPPISEADTVEYCWEKNDTTSIKSNTTSIKENKENQIVDDAKIENKCSPTTCEYWGENLKIIQQMASDLYAMKVGLTTQGPNSTSILEHRSLKDYNFQKCPYSTELQLYIKDLLEHLTTCAMTKDVVDLQNQTKSQPSKLQNFQEKQPLQTCSNKSCSSTFPSTSKDI